MKLLPSPTQFSSNIVASELVAALRAAADELDFGDAVLFLAFPKYRDDDGEFIQSDCTLVSQRFGVVAFSLIPNSRPDAVEIARISSVKEQVVPYIVSRLLRTKALRANVSTLKFMVRSACFGPRISRGTDVDETVLRGKEDVTRYLGESDQTVTNEVFAEIVATIEGAKALLRPSRQVPPGLGPLSKGAIAAAIEAAMTKFDDQQQHGMMGAIVGPQRIRGLAGSGKTVVLAMKAAITHIQFPDASIAYTFYTKSLYQHVKRLITRFYRQFHDRDPDWEGGKLKVLHGWGGTTSGDGVYQRACAANNVEFLSLADAAAKSTGDHFDYACSRLLASADRVLPAYDFVFVDEGQDFPLSFLKLCNALARDNKFVLAYDDLQSIFQAGTPTAAEIFGVDRDGRPLHEFTEDVVLHRCYRNPREVLVAAHALGFGIYGDIVQMLESPEHWRDIGYNVIDGELVEGSTVTIERPPENSGPPASPDIRFGDVVTAKVVADIDKEVSFVANSIRRDVDDGLQPHDVLVICVDDRHAKTYLSAIEVELHKLRLRANNTATDAFGIRDFMKLDAVTLATVHKAKGNEAFSVYVVGVDALMRQPNVRRRNMLFTAMSRAKGWVVVSGMGESAQRCADEIRKAESSFPHLVFVYPNAEHLKIMHRDLAEAADRKLKLRRLMEELREAELSEEEVARLLRESKESTPPKTPKRPRRA